MARDGDDDLGDHNSDGRDGDLTKAAAMTAAVTTSDSSCHYNHRYDRSFH